MAKIAVIGSGISGLASAWILSQAHEVTLYEKNDYIGGHTNTREATLGSSSVSADTGFMVFNEYTYTNMLKMFEFLGVEHVDTNMSFGISAHAGAFQFSSDNVFVKKRNIFSPAHLRMIIDIIRFNKTVGDVVEEIDGTATVRDLLHKMNLGSRFQEYYLLPMSGAIWSTKKEDILEYPAKKFVTFFNNHGLLSPKTLNPFKLKEGRLQWRTVHGGAKTYVQKILSTIKADIKISHGVSNIIKHGNSVEVQLSDGSKESFDHVICATHPDQYLSMIENPTIKEAKILSAFVYSKNFTYMHKDTSFMMSGTKKWPSWTYTETNDAVEISYYMNRLQSLATETPVIVTLNPSRTIREEDIFYKTTYEHPIFNLATAEAQKNITSIQGEDNVWFAGAWLGYGFHEDGLKSALAVGKAFGLSAPWEATPDS
jgi:uncharacterized protein